MRETAVCLQSQDRCGCKQVQCGTATYLSRRFGTAAHNRPRWARCAVSRMSLGVAANLGWGLDFQKLSTWYRNAGIGWRCLLHIKGGLIGSPSV
ncbi:unnamed protein product [Chondrus crispus]|uniref:Uncharacterized protein n=1 Tax=Chondrus crispus TaxID=2769 RepID=R7QI84_CHOCR|nr:unnamed protein product [Chondrus crispus]CDF38227.1 unnamed protein product [Chondrus crispus]|eukprot:XP_005718112.1 unnamed protein product [Chondrus crispus]